MSLVAKERPSTTPGYLEVLLIALVVFVGLAAAFGYWRFGRSVEVAVATARQGAVPLRVLGPGTLQARTAVSLASRVNATVVEVLADVGHSVRKGQLLVTLDDRESSARLAAVQGQQGAVARNIECSHKLAHHLDLAESLKRQRSSPPPNRSERLSPYFVLTQQT